ncbi:MAG: hypothetical protein HFI41_00050 [Lachnospiraceae bacterium]|nr:hypothetical protein [Lachnospiraceae bacterium]
MGVYLYLRKTGGAWQGRDVLDETGHFQGPGSLNHYAFGSPHGQYDISWSYEGDGTLKIQLTVPYGGSAWICLPDGRDRIEVGAGTYLYELA